VGTFAVSAGGAAVGVAGGAFQVPFPFSFSCRSLVMYVSAATLSDVCYDWFTCVDDFLVLWVTH